MLNTRKIEILRKQNLISQPDMAEMLNVSTNTYQNWLKNREFRATSLEKIAKEFSIKIGYLFDEEENNMEKLNEPVETYGLKKENQLLKDLVKQLKDNVELLKNQKK